MNSKTPEHPLLILAQYIKDFSFENPNAPEIYGNLTEHPPEVTVNVDVIPKHLDQRTYEIVLAMRIKAESGDKVAFLIELDYAGIVNIHDSASAEELEWLVFSEAPRHFFPFARNILADATRDASFPPVVVNPIDFDQYYRRHKTDALTDAEAQPPATDAVSSDAG